MTYDYIFAFFIKNIKNAKNDNLETLPKEKRKKEKRQLPSHLPCIHPLLRGLVFPLLGSGHCYWCGWLAQGWSGRGKDRSRNAVLVFWDCDLWTSGSRGAWAALSGFRGRDLLAQAAIKSPISAWWPPPSLWTSDYFCNSHNLNPPLWPDPFNVSSPPCLCSSFLCWHTDFTWPLGFLLAQEIPQFLRSFQDRHHVPLTLSKFFTPGFRAKPSILISLMGSQD